MIRVIAASLINKVIAPTGFEDIANQLPGNTTESLRVFPSLDPDREELVGALLAEFLPAQHFGMSDRVIELLLMRKDLLELDGRLDPIEKLMKQLGTSERRQAVAHVLNHNKAEMLIVKEEMKAMEKSAGLVRLIGLRLKRHTQLSHLLVTCLYDKVENYVRDRAGRCMYDYVPMEFRDPVKYDAMFTEVDRRSIGQSRPSDVHGVFMFVDSQSPVHDPTAILSGDIVTGIVRVERNTSTTMLTATCAASLSPKYRHFLFYPGMRSITAVDGGIGSLWREHSLAPVTYGIPTNSQIQFIAPLERDYFSRAHDGLKDDSEYILIGFFEGYYISLLLVAGEQVVPFKVTNVFAKYDRHDSHLRLEHSFYHPGIRANYVSVKRIEVYQWEPSTRQEFADIPGVVVCSFRVTRFLDSVNEFRRSLQRPYGDLLRGRWFDERSYAIVRFMFGLRDQPEAISESQRVLAEVLELEKGGKQFEAWRFVPSKWWDRIWAYDFIWEVATRAIK